jgi:hypothetical protein
MYIIDQKFIGVALVGTLTDQPSPPRVILRRMLQHVGD